MSDENAALSAEVMTVHVGLDRRRVTMLDERSRCSVEDSTSKMTDCLSEDEGPEDENAIRWPR